MGYWDENGIYQRGNKPEKEQADHSAKGKKRGAKTKAKHEAGSLKKGLDHTWFGLGTAAKQLKGIEPGGEMKSKRK